MRKVRFCLASHSLLDSVGICDIRPKWMAEWFPSWAPKKIVHCYPDYALVAFEPGNNGHINSNNPQSFHLPSVLRFDHWQAYISSVRTCRHVEAEQRRGHTTTPTETRRCVWYFHLSIAFDVSVEPDVKLHYVHRSSVHSTLYGRERNECYVKCVTVKVPECHRTCWHISYDYDTMKMPTIFMITMHKHSTCAIESCHFRYSIPKPRCLSGGWACERTVICIICEIHTRTMFIHIVCHSGCPVTLMHELMRVACVFSYRSECLYASPNTAISSPYFIGCLWARIDSVECFVVVSIHPTILIIFVRGTRHSVSSLINFQD